MARITYVQPNGSAQTIEVPSVGGSNCCGAPTPSGPVDQRLVESRHDVLVYTSDYLTEEIEVHRQER